MGYFRRIVLLAILVWTLSVCVAAQDFLPPPPELKPSSSLEKSTGLGNQATWIWADQYMRLGADSLASNLLSLTNLKDYDAAAIYLNRATALMEFTGSLLDAKEVEQRASKQPADDACYLYLASLRTARRQAQPQTQRALLKLAKPLLSRLTKDQAGFYQFCFETAEFALEYSSDPHLARGSVLARYEKAVAHLKQGGEGNLPPLLAQWVAEYAGLWAHVLVEEALNSGAQSATAKQIEEALDRNSNVIIAALTRSEGLDRMIATAQVALLAAEAVVEFRFPGYQEDVNALLLELEPAVQKMGETHKTMKPRIEQLERLTRKAVDERLGQAESPELDQLKALAQSMGIDANAPTAHTDFAGVAARFYKVKTVVQLAAHPGKLKGDELESVKTALLTFGEYSQDVNNEELKMDWDELALELVSRQKNDGWPDQILQISRTLLMRSDLVGSSLYKSRGLHYQALAQAAKGDRETALKKLDQAIAAVESYATDLGGSHAAKARLRERFNEMYELRASLQMKLGRAQDALMTLERQRQIQNNLNLDLGKLFRETPQAQAEVARVTRSQGRTAALQQRLAEVKALPQTPSTKESIQVTQKLLATSKAEFTQHLDSLRSKLGPGYDRFLSVKPIQFTRLQRDIPANTAVLQVFYTPDSEEIYLFAITKENFRTHSVAVSGGDLDRKIRSLRRRLIRVDSGSFSWKTKNSQALLEGLSELHALLVDPIEKDIADKEVLAFVPGGALHYLPIQALARVKNGQPEFLIERKQVVSLTRTSDFSELKTQVRKGQGTAVCFGNPDESLPGAELEVGQLKRLFPDASVFLREQATEDQLLKATGIKFLHLATHGILDKSNPDLSYLVMAGSGDKAKLTRYEIIGGLDLSETRLVTLSACQTALGEKNAGNEVTSIAESFWAAGAPSVLASLWEVSDEATQSFMLSFYGQLKTGQSVGKALQSAQVDLLRNPKYGHPYYWAPFVLWGDWR